MTFPALNYRTVSILMLMTLACIYSLSFLFASLASAEVGPATAGATRILFGAIFLIAVSQISGVGFVRGRVLWGYAAAYGIVCLAVPFTLLPWTLGYVSNTTASIYFAAIPLEVLVLSRIFLGTHITPRKWLGFGIASAGLVMLAIAGARGDEGAMASEIMRSQGDDIFAESQMWVPHLLCNLAALCLAAGGVLFQKMPRAPLLAISSSALLLGNVIAIPLLILNMPQTMPSVEGWIWMVGAGLMVTGGGTLLRGALIRRESAIFTSMNGYVVPLITAALGLAVLGETLTTTAVIAYLLVMAGLLVARNRAAARSTA